MAEQIRTPPITDAEWSVWLEDIIDRALEHSVLRSMRAAGRSPIIRRVRRRIRRFSARCVG